MANTQRKRNLLCGLSVVGILLGCGGRVENISINRYEVSTPYADDVPYEQMVANLDERAEGRCDEGYRKISDFDTYKNGQRLLVWAFTCEGVNRYDTRYILTTPNEIPK